ncbi:unnamed protein product [Symbiodinium natans]|uniref:SnoaL-like domain-containing protein n=1 Tax=Symbiodinium natans TaxID=878477 RepID=A0A812IIN6_9DINO|nr:unnamed protein product [Symbiodinium natans]
MDPVAESTSGQQRTALRKLVEVFYERVWNACDDDALFAILAPDVRFRGSTEAVDRVGPEAFKMYRDAIHEKLHNYTCTIQDVVVDETVAFARVWFSGTHSGGPLLGVPPTQRPVRWIGAARFALAKEGSQIGDIWVLGDLHSLSQQLQDEAAAEEQPEEKSAPGA